jgi:hypothetical protein
MDEKQVPVVVEGCPIQPTKSDHTSIVSIALQNFCIFSPNITPSEAELSLTCPPDCSAPGLDAVNLLAFA